MLHAKLIGSRVVVEDEREYEALRKRGLGGRKTDVVSPLEALYLVLKKELVVTKNNHKLSFAALFAVLKKTDRELSRRWMAYRDLRGKGYLPKSGFKFGCDFNVYPKGAVPQDPAAHGKFLVKVIRPNLKVSVQDMALRVRLSQNVKKSLYFAAVDEKKESVDYIRIKFILP
ncbi:tRNA-intron lyase [Candidatus Micrarchaeota archaeon]|nr:tRNA-intron lyase [Candidatus Micrarchaeota archaeon]